MGEKAARKGELRIGAVRFLPRGVKKAEHGKFFDIWLPLSAPSKKLVSAYMRSANREKAWPGFSKAYEREMERDAAARVTVRLVAEVARRIPVALGCYCENESMCHRSILKALIIKASKGGVR
ncbi:MAG: DUF488 family protein [Deltaproteobacteria bacterium]|nr:DUF488 family protein [Deltaproteobacteria bacterium]